MEMKTRSGFFAENDDIIAVCDDCVDVADELGNPL
jgi:hypothetical protein